ncbi:MAG TPA: choice-of-anchor D domain-containing protein, partial [Polyangia bacterium]|nr:choice-of-anchor D domain-containing protein [Polyangia bacterium]
VMSADTCTGISVPAAGTCTVNVALKPAAAGALTAVLSVSAPSGNPGSIQLSGIGLPPGALTVSPSSYDFGSISIKAVSADTTFTVTNNGGAATGPLTVSAPGNGFVVAGNSCAAGLQPAKTCAVAVRFAPTVVGNATGTVTIGDGTVSGTLTLHGTATAAAMLTIDPPTTCAGAELLPSSHHAYDPTVACPGSAWEFKATVIGLTNGAAPNGSGGNNGVTFTVTSDAQSPSDTGTLTVATTGDAKDDFVIASTNCAAALAPGASCTVKVNFTPTAAGTRAAILQVTTSKGGTAGANLNAIGMPFIEILPCSNANGTSVGNTAVVTPPHAIPASSDSDFNTACTPLDSTGGTDFGQVPVGVFDPNDILSQEKVFVVRVRGASASPYTNTLTLGVTTPTAPADFRIDTVNTTCNTSAMDVSSATLRQCLVYLEFYPQTTTGDKTGTLTITGSNGGTASVNVSGTATGPLTITPAPVPFGTVNVGSVDMTEGDAGQPPTVNARSVTVSNFGTTAQGPLSFAVTGANAAEFKLVDDNCTGATLAAHAGKCTLSYLMIPTTAGAKSATLTVTSGTLTSTAQFVGNAGTATTITVSPLTNDFGKVAANARSAFLTVTVSAVGTAQTGTILYTMVDDGFEIATGTDVGSCGVTDTQSLGGSNPASCTIKVRFHPTSMGVQLATLAITDSVSGQLVNVALKGTSTSQITITPATQDFNSVAVNGTSSAFTFTATNNGLTAVTPTVGFDALSPLTTAAFSASTSTTCNNTVTSLAPGSTCVVVLKLDPAPSSTGRVGAKLQVGGTTGTAALTATIVKAATLDVVGFTTDHSSGYANHVDFGTVRTQSASLPVTFWFTNNGGVSTSAIHYTWVDTTSVAPLGTLGDSPDSYFPFGSDTSGNSCISGTAATAGLAPGALCSVTFSLRPQVLETTYTATLELSATNVADASGAITAIGHGAAATAASYIDPPFWDFSTAGPTAVGSSTAAKTFTLHGNASGPLSVTTVGNACFSSTLCGDFAIDPTVGAQPCGTDVLTSNVSCTFTVTFTPTHAEVLPTYDQYRFGSVSAGNVVAGFTGKVTQPATLSIGSAVGGNDFGNVIITSPVNPVTKTMTITNSGNVASAVLTLRTAALNSSFGVEDDGASDAGLFSVNTACNKAIAPGETCSFVVTLTPPTTPQAIPSGSGYKVLVEATKTSGSTTTAVADSSQDDPLIANVLNASALQILPTKSSNTAQFGSQPVGTAGDVTTFTIKNSNAGVLTHASGVLTIQLAGGLTSNYTLDTSNCATYMATGSTGLDISTSTTCVVTVAFNPAVTATLGALTDTLTVTAANDGATASLKLNGTAISAMSFVDNDTSVVGQFKTVLTTQSCGTVAANAPFTFDVSGNPTGPGLVRLWVENAVGAPDTGLLSTSLTGSSFRLVWDNCTGERLGYTNGESEFCDLGVRFEPSASGAATGSVTVSGTPGNSATLALTGTGS